MSDPVNKTRTQREWDLEARIARLEEREKALIDAVDLLGAAFDLAMPRNSMMTIKSARARLICQELYLEVKRGEG